MANASSTPPAQLGGRIAIVTGGTQGLGEAIAELFVERGAKGLVICGRNAQNGRQSSRAAHSPRLRHALRPSRPCAGARL